MENWEGVGEERPELMDTYTGRLREQYRHAVDARARLGFDAWLNTLREMQDRRTAGAEAEWRKVVTFSGVGVWRC